MVRRRTSKAARDKAVRAKRRTVTHPIHRMIADRREALRMSQDDLARECKVDKSAVSHWENGFSQPKSDRWPKVAAVLGLEIEDLYREAA